MEHLLLNVSNVLSYSVLSKYYFYDFSFSLYTYREIVSFHHFDQKF